MPKPSNASEQLPSSVERVLRELVANLALSRQRCTGSLRARQPYGRVGADVGAYGKRRSVAKTTWARWSWIFWPSRPNPCASQPDRELRMNNDYTPQDRMSLWWLGDPAAPRLVGTLNLADSARKLAQQVGAHFGVSCGTVSRAAKLLENCG